MPTLSEVFNSLAKRAGIAADNPELVAILANPEISKINIPDSLKASMESGLHTLESAKPLLKDVLLSEWGNGLDAELYKIGMDHGMDEEAINSLKGEKKTSAKARKLTEAIKELTAKAAGATGGDKVDLVKQINSLKEQQGTLAKAHTDAIAAEQAKAAQKISNFAINSKLMGYEYAGEQPKDINAQVARIKLDQKLAALGALATYDESTGQYKLQKQDGTDVFDAANNKLSFEGVCDSVLAENKMLKISDPNKDKGGKGNETIIPGGGAAGAANYNSQLDTLLTEQGH